MISVLVFFFLGIFLSAFFSGNETGFYRVTRLRLVMDGLRGDKVAKRLLWLTNNPSLFVATTLIGNNIANYLTSLAIVMGSQRLVGQSSMIIDIVAPIALAPILFIYGESLPKNLFLKMPNYLLRKSGLAFMVFFACLIPVSSFLWLIGKLLERLVGQSPVKVRLALARQELDDILLEGHEAGILQQEQRDLANAMFSTVDRQIREFVKPISRFQLKNPEAKQGEIVAFGKKWKTGIVVVPTADQSEGYLKIMDLLITGAEPQPEPLLEVKESELHGSVLVKMQSGKKPIARVVDGNGQPVGYVTINDLTSEMFRR